MLYKIIIQSMEYIIISQSFLFVIEVTFPISALIPLGIDLKKLD